ncbi:hypothetical protein SAMN04487910_4483 [Aquimarina amphilecti]|uniref:Uncharacterized protein n=1 Tax=Aquimarina amphilecti TaxID=1038014 RepID=A0A1H7WP78_AQUAM|nr:hypothetical protein [Aquimarina amphilecti]SEM22965.1 hypothetical protein SAMN04487910_4483 [Aquimarina amphilecti]
MLAIILLIIIVTIIVIYYQSYWAKIEQHYECINYENYSLIKESPFSEECSSYQILRKENEIWFKRDGYSLFYIQLISRDSKNVELIGLDGYGIRNMEFKKYVCGLIQKIKIKHNSQ